MRNIFYMKYSTECLNRDFIPERYEINYFKGLSEIILFKKVKVRIGLKVERLK